MKQNDVVGYIQDNLNPSTILNYYEFKGMVETEDSIRACCAIHKGNNPSAFMWNKNNNLWFCYTGDCHGGDVFTLVQKMEKVDFVTAVKKTAVILGLNISGMKLINSENRIAKEQQHWLEVQRLKTNKSKTTTEYELPYTRYFAEHDSFKRFDIDILNFYESKFCKLYPTEDSLLQNKLVIPIHLNEKCVGVALRDTTGTYNPKWFYQPKGLKINSILYNMDRVKKMIDDGETDEIILVEGIFDVWAYHQIGIDYVVAIFGSSLKDEQYKELLKLGVDITLSFDNDHAGNKCTRETAKKFKNKAVIKKIQFSEGKDPGDCSKDELLESYLKRTVYVQE